MKSFEFFFLLTLAALHLQCCKPPTDYVPPTNKVTCDSSNTVLIPQDMKARFYFKEGTYWIYKNIATGETDSMWVWDGENSIVSVNPKWYTKGLNKCYESFSYLVKNKKYNINSYYSGIGITIHPNDGLKRLDEFFEIVETSPLNNFRGDFRISVRGVQYETQSEAEIKFIDSLITFEGGNYKNILMLKYPNPNTNDINNEMHYAKNIGLVKFTRSADNSTWELIRYKINQ